MFKIALMAIGLLESVALASPPASYTCDSKDYFGTKGKVTIDISSKEISLMSASSLRIYDSQTICGWRPNGGLNDINCPFTSQVADGFLSIDLGCYRGSDPTANAVSTGSLQIQNGAGSLICYIFNNPKFNLSLSHCQGR